MGGFLFAFMRSLRTMLLLTPGPVMTRPEVRAALTQDIAPWDNDFRAVYTRVLDRVLAIAGGIPEEHATLPLQGAGHFITEAAIRTFVPVGRKLLVPTTGTYSDRIVRLAREAGRIPILLPIAPNDPADPLVIEAALEADPSISHVGLVYSETGSGVIHDAVAIGAARRRVGRRMILDAVSAFGALPFDIAQQPEVDAIVFTSNKCIEALPGMGFAVARIDRLRACAGQAGSWSFDLADILIHAGRPRFTPPAQIVAAFDRALDFYDAEGGRVPRLARYTANMRAFYDGMVGLGLTPYLRPDQQGPIIVNIHAPNDPAWDLQRFVHALKARGVLISNFYNTPAPSFRVGCIGAITPTDMRGAVAAMDAVLDEIGITRREAA
jgi:2-aminoethylphosphonate-pyruvate transaminase